ncbi:uncharacterized protein [Montipora capricornis]|uniref:uncharacterized protein n=1 Tax=Montipora capricornis TaxID=246305 RepID=UPI0035F149A4
MFNRSRSGFTKVFQPKHYSTGFGKDEEKDCGALDGILSVKIAEKGVQERRSWRLKRRAYVSYGPNFCWHLDVAGVPDILYYLPESSGTVDCLVPVSQVQIREVEPQCEMEVDEDHYKEYFEYIMALQDGIISSMREMPFTSSKVSSNDRLMVDIMVHLTLTIRTNYMYSNFDQNRT